MPVRAICENDISVFLHAAVIQTDFDFGVLSAEQTSVWAAPVAGELRGQDGQMQEAAVGAVTPSYGLMAVIGNTALVQAPTWSVLRESRNSPRNLGSAAV